MNYISAHFNYNVCPQHDYQLNIHMLSFSTDREALS